jgi:hypothetical protein
MCIYKCMTNTSTRLLKLMMFFLKCSYSNNRNKYQKKSKNSEPKELTNFQCWLKKKKIKNIWISFLNANRNFTFNTSLSMRILFCLSSICFAYIHCIQCSPLASGRFGDVKSYSTHHFFGNAYTKSGSLRFSQFSDCWLILSVYILMSFDFPFKRLFGVR